MILTISPPELGPQKTQSTAEVAAAATLTYVENNDDFASGDVVLFGKIGEEKTEAVVLTGKTANNQIDHSTGPVFAHPARTPISQVLFNQVEISRAASEGGTYTVLTTIGLNFDEFDTEYNDTGGTTSSWYKMRYYNSSSATYSDYSDEVQGTGYTEDSLRSMTDEVLEDFGDTNADNISRESVKNYLNAGVRKLTQTIIKSYPDYRTNYDTLALTTSNSYALPANFLAFKRIDINYSANVATDAYKASFEGEEAGYPEYTYQEVAPRVSIRGSNLIIRPTPTAAGGYMYRWFWDYPNSMSNETDEHGLPYGARDILVTHALYRIWMTRDQDKAAKFKTLLEEQTEEYLEFIGQQRQIMGKKMVDIVFGADLYNRYD